MYNTESELRYLKPGFLVETPWNQPLQEQKSPNKTVYSKIRNLHLAYASKPWSYFFLVMSRGENYWDTLFIGRGKIYQSLRSILSSRNRCHQMCRTMKSQMNNSTNYNNFFLQNRFDPLRKKSTSMMYAWAWTKRTW